MFLIEILLPLRNGQGRPVDKKELEGLMNMLTEEFGGLTAHTRAPAQGFWKDNFRELSLDEIVIFEIISEILDKTWWKNLRFDLERRLEQKLIVIRAHSVEQL